MYAHVVLRTQTPSMHTSEDTKAHPNLLGLFPATAEKYIMIITVWVYIPELTRSDKHTIQECQGQLLCKLTGVQCWNSVVLGRGPLYYCSQSKPPGNHLSKTVRRVGPIKLQQRVRETALTEGLKLRYVAGIEENWVKMCRYKTSETEKALNIGPLKVFFFFFTVDGH